MFNQNYYVFGPNNFWTRTVGIVVGAISFPILVVGMLMTFAFDSQPLISTALSIAGELGVAFGLALIWANELRIGALKLTAFLALMGIVMLAWGAAAMFGIDWITVNFNLNSRDGDSIVQVLFLFGIVVPWIALFVVGAKWIQRRPQD